MNIKGINPEIVYCILRLRGKLGIPFKPEKEMNKLNLEKGQQILDYGCGVGSYTFSAAVLVGEEGKIYALDKQPLAIERVKGKAEEKGFHNIEVILSARETGLPEGSMDVILLYGVLREIEDRGYLLKELSRVLKPGGRLSTRFCFRMKKDEVLKVVEATGLFVLKEQKGHLLNFEKTAE